MCVRVSETSPNTWEQRVTPSTSFSTIKYAGGHSMSLGLCPMKLPVAWEEKTDHRLVGCSRNTSPHTCNKRACRTSLGSAPAQGLKPCVGSSAPPLRRAHELPCFPSMRSALSIMSPRAAMLGALHARPQLQPLRPFARQFYAAPSAFTWYDDCHHALACWCRPVRCSMMLLLFSYAHDGRSFIS